VKIPGLGDIPLLGKLFQSRTLNKSRSELLVLVTPEIVRPIPAGEARPELKQPEKMLPGAPDRAPQTPGIDVTGPVPARPGMPAIPIEQLIESEKPLPSSSQPAQAPTQFLPIPVMPMPASPGTPSTPSTTPAAAPNAPAASILWPKNLDSRFAGETACATMAAQAASIPAEGGPRAG